MKINENKVPKFHQYEREYEKVFTDQAKIKEKCNLEKICPIVRDDNDDISNTTLYIETIRETIVHFERNIFNVFVKFEWLRRKFKYNKLTLSPKGGGRGSSNDGRSVNTAYGLFMRYHVGYNHRYYFSSQVPFNKLFTYLDDFFPNFEQGNPFKEKYEYPYSYIGLDCLHVVANMPERLDLLKHAEYKKMSFAEFSDYIINYINCYNNEYGDKYIFMLSSYPPYVKILNDEEKKETRSIYSRSSRFLPSKYIRSKCNTKRNVKRNHRSKRTSQDGGV